MTNAVKTPGAMPPATTWFPPNHTTARVVAFIAKAIIGMVKMTTFIALMVLSFKSTLAVLNLSSSCFSRTNDLTTLIFVRFSWVAVLRASSFCCIMVNLGRPIFMIR